MLAIGSPITWTAKRRRSTPAHGEMVAHIVERLRDDISARFAPGARLVENDLTHRFACQPRAGARGAATTCRRRPDRARAQSRRAGATLVAQRNSRIVRDPHRAGSARRAPGRRSRDEAKRRKFSAAIAPIYGSDARSAAAYLEENTAFPFGDHGFWRATASFTISRCACNCR